MRGAVWLATAIVLLQQATPPSFPQLARDVNDSSVKVRRAALRSLAAKLGKPTTKAHPAVPGASVAINMGDMLHAPAIIDALGQDIALHLQTLYTDPRGINLRNDLAHGLLAADRMSLAVASRVLHTLLVLGIWRELANARRTPAPQTAKMPGADGSHAASAS